ncbi:hypothetical protein M2277_004403 [Paenibacillus sp. LBL]|nr:hypothetical protein B9D94_29165 [Paenibacillus sp. Cedars]MDH6673738.1 hypothetical protein [Paenibacillus sp. LBL]
MKKIALRMGGSAALPMVLVKSVDLKIMLLLVCNPDHQSSVYKTPIFLHVAIKLHECMNGFLHRLSLHQFMVHNAKGPTSSIQLQRSWAFL